MCKVQTCWIQGGNTGTYSSWTVYQQRIYVYRNISMSETGKKNMTPKRMIVNLNVVNNVNRVFMLVLTLSLSDVASKLFCLKLKLCLWIWSSLLTVYFVNIPLLCSNAMDHFKPNVTENILLKCYWSLFKWKNTYFCNRRW